MLTGSPFAGWAAAGPARLSVTSAHTRTAVHRRIRVLLGNDVDLGDDGDGARERVPDGGGPDRVLPQVAQHSRVGVSPHVELHGHLVESRMPIAVEPEKDEVVLLGRLEGDLEVVDRDAPLGGVEYEAGGQARAQRAENVF